VSGGPWDAGGLACEAIALRAWAVARVRRWVLVRVACEDAQALAGEEGVEDAQEGVAVVVV